MKKTLAMWALVAAALTPFAGVVRGQQAAAPDVPANIAPHPAPEQPLPFSHQLHVGMGLDCKTCHTNPAPGRQMTFPATATCMGCHSVIATDHPAIQKLAGYASADQPIPWVRVYKVLPGVTWTHRKHLEAGLQCTSCHGLVGDLPAMAQLTAVTAMASCIGCHQARHASTQCATCHAWPDPQSAALFGDWNTPANPQVPQAPVPQAPSPPRP